MIKQMKKCCILMLILVICTTFGISLTPVLAADNTDSTYEVKITTNNTDYFFSTIEEAFSADILQSGNPTFKLQLLKDIETDTTLIANANRSNLQIDLNGHSITSSADPVIQAGLMTFIANSAETPCSIIQKNVSTINSSSPNTIIYSASGNMVLNINAPNLTIGDNSGTAINSQAMLPSIQNGIFLGNLSIGKPMFGSAISGGYFSQDPTPHIDTNSSVAVQNNEGLYYLTTYHAATVDSDSGTVLQKYGTVQQAVDASILDGMIKLLKQGSPPQTVVVDTDDKLTLDLAGFQFIGAASPLAAIRVEGASLLNNKGNLSIIDTDKTDPGALNFVYTPDFTGDCFCTILNQGTLNLYDIFVSVNYNQPDYKGNIYTICNDSSNSDAVIYIDSESQIGGLKLEPEDPATGKYPAIMTKGNGKYTNAVHLEYAGNDTVTFFVENSIISEVMDVFDSNGNYTTTFSLNNGIDLQKRNISVKKDGVEIDFEYDSTTDTLLIPSSAFTDGTDNIEIRLKYEVTYIVDGKTFTTLTVEHGKNANMPEIPAKVGYIGKWDNNGENITADTTITALYDIIPQNDENTEKTNTSSNNKTTNNPQTGDNITIYIITFLIAGISILNMIKTKKRTKIRKH